MIDLYTVEPGTIFPRQFLGTFTHRQLLVHPVHKFTESEIGDLMAGEIVLGFMGELTPHFMEEILLDEVLAESPRLTAAEIAEIEGTTRSAITHLIFRAQEKIRGDIIKSTELRELIAGLACGEDLEIMIRSSVS
jgi:DNA-directed RNA polymerase specialized sigma24 family protein